ncbi:phosphoribosyl-AMP cyclohydrolase [Yoonia sediminilitoris]|uniref:Phosphoribosyl-AMP cyclohydrolase n=1 Tax=Yoonia sediminilitoris TaxID=1286148 RepID=A0A2T6KCX4_9RHOB|nr:phosphoribosyl-AMP cyclohydrolase [Yoonia sediminilitoris]PUB12797.1 phosphoribosyl-AMP cyclohydrolase [Yoonia sediminilitoris]
MRFDPDTLKFNDAGLIPAIAQDATSGEVLMMAWMNSEAVAKTLETGQVTYWSRSRQEFWIKGATSGNTQQLVDFHVDCDRDCLLVSVHQTGPACHTGARSCFFTVVREGAEINTRQD